jgi:carboxyl-terminal processing protease
MSLRLLTCALLASALATSATAEDTPLRELVDRVRELEAQIALVDRNAIAAPDRAALWAGATRGLVAAADPYGAYLTAAEVAVQGLGSDAMRFGLGFGWRREGEQVLVTRLVPGSPAAVAGIQVGESVLAVDGIAAGPDHLRFAETLSRGADQKHLTLRGLDGATRQLDVERADLSDDGLARVAVAAPGLAYLRLGRFLPANSPDETETVTARAVHAALAATPALRGIILDLRGCSGGNLQAAVEIASGWLPERATVIEQSGRDPARSRSWSADGPRLPDVPVVVLIDGGTASAAEVLAQALRRVRGSPLIGTPSRGKWSVQQLFLLPRGDALLLTVAQLRPPGGAVLDAPLQPDIVVAQDDATTWACWAELGVPRGDGQLGRAIETATALALAHQR